MARISLQPAFVLHSRPYRETSALVDLFTLDHGCITAVARGVRGNRSRLNGMLQPFVQVLVSWSGRGELVALGGVEAQGPHVALQGNNLMSGLYLNELLVRLLHKHDPHPALYSIYQDTLLKLTGSELRLEVLRLFEKKLLEEIGYGLPLAHDAETQLPITEGQDYMFYPQRGFVQCRAGENYMPGHRFAGKSLLALAAEILEDSASLQDAKRLMRLVFAPLLGNEKLHSRELFVST